MKIKIARSFKTNWDHNKKEKKNLKSKELLNLLKMTKNIQKKQLKICLRRCK
jgi:hypothetical protein